MSMLLIGTSLVALILLIWVRTDAWVEYTRLLHLNCLSQYKDFDEKQKMDPFLTYPIYLRRYHNHFFVRLITCPVCIAVWLGIFCGIGTSFALFPVFTVGGLILFAITDRLLG